MLKLAKVEQPLVLHLRGPPGDELGSDVQCRAMIMMEANCKPGQKLHVHCFTGKKDIVQAWLLKFPNSYFGVTAAVRSFGREQVEGLREIPINRLLLETDAPYFPLGNSEFSTPAYIGEVAAFVAVHLDMT
ncbi:hypothetical protein FSP39_005799 [Pinctada imbricata]|uniref:Uncharacterized protein n=1 Tax=Pinctada imbricata TaxID=66713 RepID=A0AA89BK18_PINIB|nr:hypothetical protein FSP39_005799 [Pinctada imbricata]